MRRIIALVAALAVAGLLAGGSPAQATATCSNTPGLGPDAVDAHLLTTGDLNGVTCNVDFYVVANVQREKSSTWAAYSPPHNGLSSSGTGCGNGSKNLDDAFGCPSSAGIGPHFDAGSQQNLTGPTWTYSQNILADNYRTIWRLVNNTTGATICNVTEYWFGPPYQTTTC